MAPIPAHIHIATATDLYLDTFICVIRNQLANVARNRTDVITRSFYEYSASCESFTNTLDGIPIGTLAIIPAKADY